MKCVVEFIFVDSSDVFLFLSVNISKIIIGSHVQINKIKQHDNAVIKLNLHIHNG